MKYTSHFPLGIVIPLLACSVPLQAAENMTEQSTPDESAATAENHEETMVITAARQNLQAPGVSTITAVRNKTFFRRPRKIQLLRRRHKIFHLF